MEDTAESKADADLAGEAVGRERREAPEAAIARRWHGLGFAARTPLYANAYALLANQVSSAALGFLYWLLAARLYPVDVVGRSSAVISVLLLIASLSQLGLDGGMVRFVPRAGKSARRLILAAYAVVPACAAVLSVAFLWLSDALRLDEKLAIGALPPGLLVAATVAWAVFYFQDGILNGLRQSVWVLIENLLYNVAKIGLLVAGVWLLKENGIIASWFLPTPLTIALVAWLVLTRFARRDAGSTASEAESPINRGEFVRSVAADHLGSIVSEASVRVLPLLVVGLLGPAQNAYFYQAWLVATTLSLAASGMSHSFTAQAAGDRANVAVYSRGILRQMFLLLAPVAVLIGAGAPLVLALFGREYASEAATLLRWLALTAPIVIFDTWYLAYERVMERLGRVVALQAVSSVLLLGVGYWAIQRYGIAGVGLAWLVSRASIALVGAVRFRGMVWGDRGEGAEALDGVRLLAPNEMRLVLPFPDGAPVADFSGAKRRPAKASAVRAEAGTCGIALVTAPTDAALASAFTALRPGGACYSEWPAWRRGGVEGVRRRSRAAGFEDERVYWPVGRRRHGRLLLAFPASERYGTVVRRMLEERFPAPLGRMASAVAGFALRTGLVPHAVAVATKPGGPAGRMPALSDWVVGNVARSDPEGGEPTVVMATGAGPANKKAHWLVFSGEDPELRWVVKIPRREEGSESVRREIALLDRLARRRDLDAKLVVPRVCATTEAAGFPVHLESALAGPRMDTSAETDAYEVTASRATAALVALAGTPEAGVRAEWWDRIVEPPLARLASGLEGLDPDGVPDRVREALSGLGAVPLVCAHNDCAPWNAVPVDDRLGLFDWETGRESWLPVVDLTYFLANAAFCADGTANTPRAARTYAGLLDGSDARAAAFHASLRSYAEAVGVRLEDVGRLRLATWLLHTADEFDTVLRPLGDRSRRLLGRSACLPLLRLELDRLDSRGEEA